MPIYPPYVIERTSRGERSYDIFSRLLMDRIVFLGSAVDDTVANIIVAQLLFLDAEDPERDIYLYINSPGGASTRGSPSTTRCSTSGRRSLPSAWGWPPPWAHFSWPGVPPGSGARCPTRGS
jgi:hypothetical protein